MRHNIKKIESQLLKRANLGNKRTLGIQNPSLIDFCSNDYLGFSRSSELKARILKAYSELNSKNGSTGSRLLTGNSNLAEQIEMELASIFGFESCLVFNSGYSANLGFFSAVPQRGDTILYDELSHACIKDGCRLSLAKAIPFKHNDLSDLERKLKNAEGEIYIACESVYSMDGDFAPLKALSDLSEQYNSKLIVDEAHSTGVFGQNGAGLVAQLGLTNRVFAVIFTFGKAMGIHGACIASNLQIREYLINFSRPFIYTTAPSGFDFLSIREAFTHLRENPSAQQAVHQHIELFNASLNLEREARYTSQSAIQVILTPGNEMAKRIAQQLLEKGYDIRPILSPTVKAGEERLRICLHTFNSTEQVISLTQSLNSLLC
jgi:8-amino-7-oxononanoate synthase